MSDPSPPPPPVTPPVSQPGGAQTSSHAIASLVLGILGFVMLPLVGSILAIVFAGMADREIVASGGTLGGKGFADAGRILGIIGLALAVIVIGLIIVAFVIFDWHFVRLDRFPEIRFTINR